MKKEFFKSLIIFIPAACLQAYFIYDGSNLIKSLLFGCFASSCIFFVPYLFKHVKKEK